jgi:signal transduction histidine kinase
VGSVWAERRAIAALGGRVRVRLRWEYAVLAAGMAAAVLAAMATGHVAHSEGQALLVANAVAGFTIAGVCWLHRRPASMFGYWLLAFAGCTALESLGNSSVQHLYAVGVSARAPFVIVGLYCFLSFPSGHLRGRGTRILMWVGAPALALSTLPAVLATSWNASTAPLGGCTGSCPTAQVADVPGAVSSVLVQINHVAPALVALAVCVVLLHRFWAGSPPERRGLRWMVAFATAASAMYAVRWLLIAHDGSSAGGVEELRWAGALAWALLPWAFIAPLVQSQMFARSALYKLLADLAARPEPSAWERDVGRALDDPGLRLAFWSPSDQAYLGVAGDVIERVGVQESWYAIERDGEPVAAILHDPALDGDPELLRAAGDATLLSLDGRHLEDEIRAARASAIATAEEERRRLERDLHDGAQQHLIALRIKLGLMSELSGGHTAQMIAELGDDVDATLDELRRLAQGVYPPLLRAHGLDSALKAVARRAATPVSVKAGGLGRYPNEIESAVYFCCLEALQNAAKHAGGEAAVTVRVASSDGWLRFAVEDTGAGFDTRLAGQGAGLANMGGRMEAVGGRLRVVSAPGCGATVSGLIPIHRPPSPAAE